MSKFLSGGIKNSSGTFGGSGGTSVAYSAAFTGSGSTTSSTATFYSAPGSTTGTASTWYFNYFAQPIITLGTTATSASTLYIAGAPTNTTTSYSLQVAAGKTYIGGALQIPTGASNGYVLQSDASGNATWANAASSNSFTAAGSTTAASATLYSSPTTTAFTGSNNYFFNYFNTPAMSGSTTGIASTVYIAGAPTSATTPYALNVAAGTTSLSGLALAPLIITGTSSPQTLTISNNQFVICNTTGAVTLNLPASPISGQCFTIINTANFAISVSTNGSNYFDGSASNNIITLNQYDRLNIIYYNTFWYSL